MQSIAVDELEEGDVFDCPVYTASGCKLSEPFTFLRSEQLRQLRQWGVDELEAESGPLTDEELQEYRERARRARESERTTKSDLFGVDDPVAEGNVEPADSVEEPVKRRVKRSYERCLEGTKKVLKPLSQGRIGDVKSLYEIIQPIFEVAWDMQSALLYLLADLEGDDEDDYLFPYSLHTCLLSVLLAKEMDYDEPEARKVGVAGLVHDVGMLKIPQHIRQSTGGLDEEQKKMINSHPQRGARILEEVDRLESSIKRVAAEHHEQVDGSGYPLGVDHEQIHPHSRIVNLAMTFVAMTQKRSHRSSLTAQESLQELFKNERDRYDGRVLKAFLKRFGVYPPGSFVELDTGNVALVMHPNREDPSNPEVKVLTTPSRSPLSKPFDVSLVNYDVSIVGVIEDPSLGSALELA